MHVQHIHSNANELLHTFTLTGKRKINLSLRIELEESSEAPRSDGGGRKSNGMKGKDK